MTCVVISQPMFFPWVGLFEQIRLADVHVHYDDVQFSKGSFTNRVQIKTASGVKWLTLPVTVHLGDAIKDVRLASDHNWKQAHVAFLKQALADAPYAGEALKLVQSVYASAGERMIDVVIASMQAVVDYFDLAPTTRFVRSSSLDIGGQGWKRVLAIVKALGGDRYVTGHGARHYLAHDEFDAAGVAVEYLDYERRTYPQLHGAFTPYVSVLDLIANCGRAGRDVIASSTKPWRRFLASATTNPAGAQVEPAPPRRPLPSTDTPTLPDTEQPMSDGTLTLRPPEPGDRENLLRWRSDPENRRVLMWRSGAESLDDVDAWIARRTLDSQGSFALVARAEQAIGFVQLSKIDRVDGHAYLGLFVDPAERERGSGTQALSLMEAEAEHRLGLRKLLLEVLADNATALRFWVRRGYTVAGRWRNHHEHGGTHHDVVLLEKLLGSAPTARDEVLPRHRSDIPNDAAVVHAMAADGEVDTLRARLLSLMGKYRYAYNWTWYGRPVIQLPQDLLALQMLILDQKPDFIIETGIAHGGSLVFSASMLELLGRGQVLGIDIDIREHNRAAIEAHPLAHRISMLQGSSVADDIVAEVRRRAREARHIMVCLDSNHTAEHVARELELYAPLVTPGQHLVVFDTAIEDLPASDFPDRPWGPGNSPKTAVRAFLAGNTHFQIDRDLEERLLFSVAPEGYLKRVS